jgi:hypothetical protein
MPATGPGSPYGLHRPSMHDAREAVHRVHGANGPAVWDRLLTKSGLGTHDTDDADLLQLLDTMADLDPVSGLCAQALRIRLASHTHLSAAHTLTRS